MRNNFFKGISSGLCIALGGGVYLACDNKYIGALFFTVALLSICYMRLSLFTGMVGFMAENHKKSDFINLFAGLLGNFTGCVVFGLIMREGLPLLSQAASVICENKLLQNPLSSLIRSFFCGVLMYIAVYIFRKKNSIIGIAVCIPVFILSGFEHSVADMFYFSVSGIFSVKALIFTIIIIIGNSAGALLLPCLQKAAKEKDE